MRVFVLVVVALLLLALGSLEVIASLVDGGLPTNIPMSRMWY